MSEWERATLGEVLTETKDKNADGSIDLVLSVTEKRGIIPQTDVYKKRIATDDVTGYKVLRPGDVAWNPYLLWCGAVGQWLGDEPGVTSPVYPVYRAVAGQDSRFWGLVLESGRLTDYFDSTAIGSISRRRRTTPSVFEHAVVEVPPLAEQGRIVDVIVAVDTQIEALDAEAAIYGRLSGLVVNSGDGQVDPLGDAVRARGGKRMPKGEAFSDEPTTHPYLRVVDMGGLTFDSEHLEYVPDHVWPSISRYTVQPGELVVSIVGTIGRIALVPEWAAGANLTENAAVIDVDATKVNTNWLAAWLTSPDGQSEIERVTVGTSQGKLALSRIPLIEAPRIDVGRQAELGEAAMALIHAERKVRDAARRLVSFRSTLLTALLSQQIEIPESYDALLDDAVEVSA